MTSFSSARLRGHRHGTGTTLADLGAAVGRSADTVKAYEHGRGCPPADVLGGLATALGVPVDELFARHDDPTLDYVEAVAQHSPPLPDDALRGAAAVLRAIRNGRVGPTGAQADTTPTRPAA